MAGWEHTTTALFQLGDMGADGWELIAVDGASLFWKRPLLESKDELEAAASPSRRASSTAPPTPTAPASPEGSGKSDAGK